MKELKKVNLYSYKTVSRNNSEENPKNRRQGLRDSFVFFFLCDFPVGLETIFQKAQEKTTCTAVLIFFAVIKIFGPQSV